MPKKQKKTKSKKSKRLSKAELELVEEIKEAESELQISPTSDQEKEIKLNIDENKFIESLQPISESTAPVLEKIADAPQAMISTGIIGMENKDKEKQETGYMPKTTTAEDYKTLDQDIQTQGIPLTQPTHINIETTGKIPSSVRTHHFQSGIGELRQQNKNLEKDYTQIERIEKDERLPFQKTERKYKGRDI